jgi:phage tail-like protein
MASQTYYPPVGFHFKVEFDLDGIRDQDFRFQEVGGLNVEIETEPIKSGGENRFTYALPTRAKYNNLSLKRGLFTNSRLITWCKEAVESLEVEPTTVFVTLLNEQHEALQLYTFINAYPLKWSISDFNAEENKLVIETLELSFHYFKIS